jgi:hypothetical protein
VFRTPPAREILAPFWRCGRTVVLAAAAQPGQRDTLVSF